MKGHDISGTGLIDRLGLCQSLILPMMLLISIKCMPSSAEDAK